MKQPTILTIFGATGDLVRRKIIPSLYNLYRDNQLPEKFKIVAFARRDFRDERYNEIIAESLELQQDEIKDFCKLFSYVQGDFNDLDSYEKLKIELINLDGHFGECASKMFYLAVPPEYFKDLFNHLAESRITLECSAEGQFAKILVEKPFGSDLKTSEELEEILCKLFDDRQIYRIDHYLAKWLIDNIIAFRSTNSLFEPIWNNKFIEEINITILEEMGVEKRGGFYDKVGALRDVGQNHLLEILALLTMKLPEEYSAGSVRESRGDILKKLKVLTEEEIISKTNRAQYIGYRDIDEVNNESNTETYFKIPAEISDERWEGVKFLLESGKKFRSKKKEILIKFKKIKEYKQNYIRFVLEPDEAIEIGFNVRNAMKNEIVDKTVISNLKNQDSKQYVAEYTQLLLDAIEGNQKNFVSADEVRAMWRFIDPIIQTWDKNLVPLDHYQPGVETL